MYDIKPGKIAKTRLFQPVCFLPIICFLAAFIRVQNLPSLEEQYLLDPDSYRFFRQAQIIVEKGHLPEQDMMRWVPLGRNLSQHLNLLSYILAYTFRILHIIAPSLTVYQVVAFSSIVFFLMLLVVVYIVASQIFNQRIALWSVNLLAVLDSGVVLSRTCAGFADRDTLSLLLGVSAFGCYLQYIRTPIFRCKIIWNSYSALFVILLGLTWEGSVFFIVILTGLNLIRFLFYTNRTQDTLFFLGWFLPIAVGLLLLTHAYRGGANVSSPFATMVFLPPIWLIVMSCLHLVIRRHTFLGQLLTFQNRLPLQTIVFIGFSALTAMVAGFLYLISVPFHQYVILLIHNFLTPLGRSRLMQAVMELNPPNLSQWVHHYRAIFLCFLASVMFSLYSLGKSLKLNSWIPMSLCGILLINLFYRQEISAIFKGEAITLSLYLGSIFLFVIGMFSSYLYSCWKQANVSQNEDAFITDSGFWLLFLWFILSLCLARGAIRYDFFFTPVTLIYAAYALDLSFKWLVPQDRNDYIFLSMTLTILVWEMAAIDSSPNVFSLALVVTLLLLTWSGWSLFQQNRYQRYTRLVGWGAYLTVMLCLMVFVPVVGGFAPSSFNTVKMFKPFPPPDLLNAFDWMRVNLPKGAVVAAEWSYGSQINVLAQRSTIIDEDHYIPYWIYLTNRHVFAAETEQEALEFLKTHKVTHLLLDSRLFSSQMLEAITFIGSNAENDRVVKPAYLITGVSEEPSQIVFLFPGPPGFDLNYRGKNYRRGEWRVNRLILTLGPSDEDGEEVRELKTVKATADLNGTKVDLQPQTLYFQGKLYKAAEGDVLPGTFIIFPALLEIKLPGKPVQKHTTWHTGALPADKKPNLMMKLYWGLSSSSHFRQIYPAPDDAFASVSPVKIWEIVYPADLKPNPKYLETDFPPALYDFWMLGKKLPKSLMMR